MRASRKAILILISVLHLVSCDAIVKHVALSMAERNAHKKEIIKQKIVLQEDISALGTVKYRYWKGSNWNMRSLQPIKASTVVRVVEIKNNTIWVEPDR